MSTSPIVHRPKTGVRVRVAIEYGNMWRPMLWVRVGRDGSIYTGTLLGSPTSASSGTSKAGQLTRYADGTELTGARLPKSSRVSFKVDGEIHLGKKDLPGKPLTTISQPRQLCLYLFTHPSKYREGSTSDPHEMEIRVRAYEVDETRPIYGSLVVQPWNLAAPVESIKLPNMTYGASVSLGFTGFRKVPDLLLKVVIGHGVEGQWPERSVVVVC